MAYLILRLIWCCFWSHCHSFGLRNKINSDPEASCVAEQNHSLQIHFTNQLCGVSWRLELSVPSHGLYCLLLSVCLCFTASIFLWFCNSLFASSPFLPISGTSASHSAIILYPRKPITAFSCSACQGPPVAMMLLLYIQHFRTYNRKGICSNFIVHQLIALVLRHLLICSCTQTFKTRQSQKNSFKLGITKICTWPSITDLASWPGPHLFVTEVAASCLASAY